jgi:hypothetical protein
MLVEQKKTSGLAKGGQLNQATGSAKVPVETPTLADCGIDKKLSMRAQTLAAAPDAEFAAKLAAWRKNAEERQDRITANILNTGDEAGPRKGNGHSPHARCIQLDHLCDCWDDVGLAMAISRLMRAAWHAPDAPEKGVVDPAAAHQAIGEMESWVARLRKGRCDDDDFGA